MSIVGNKMKTPMVRTDSYAALSGGAFLCCGSIQIPFHIVSSACFSSDLSIIILPDSDNAFG